MVVCSRWILWSVVLILAVILWVVLAIWLWAVLAIVLLLTVTLLWLLSVVSERRSEEAPLSWRRVLIRVTLLLVLCSVNEGHVGPRDPPSPVHGESEEYRGNGQESGH